MWWTVCALAESEWGGVLKKCPLSTCEYNLGFHEPVGRCCQTCRQHAFRHIKSARGSFMRGNYTEEAHCSQCSWPDSDIRGLRWKCVTGNWDIYWSFVRTQTKLTGCIFKDLSWTLQVLCVRGPVHSRLTFLPTIDQSHQKSFYYFVLHRWPTSRRTTITRCSGWKSL